MSEDIKKDKNEECCGGEDCGCDGTHTHEDNDGCGEGCGCGHDHDHDHDHAHDLITLTLDDDEEVECAVLGIFDVEDKEYIALLPHESEDVFIYLYHESEAGDVSLENIESQEDFDKVSAVFLEIIENENEEEGEE